MDQCFDPEMTVALQIYAFCVGVASSRKIEKATYEMIPFRVLTADQHPSKRIGILNVFEVGNTLLSYRLRERGTNDLRWG